MAHAVGVKQGFVQQQYLGAKRTVQTEDERICRRFFAAMILHDLINEVSSRALFWLHIYVSSRGSSAATATATRTPCIAYVPVGCVNRAQCRIQLTGLQANEYKCTAEMSPNLQKLEL